MADAVDFDESFFVRLGVSEGVTDLVLADAERVAAIARHTAPVDTGAYRDGISVALKTQDRSVALVISTDSKTFLIEAKTGNLARALRAAAVG